MPSTSARQHGAMAAAAHGKGRLGIPAEVAREFIEETPPKKRSEFARANARKRVKRKKRKRHTVQRRN